MVTLSIIAVLAIPTAAVSACVFFPDNEYVVRLRKWLSI